MSLNNSANDLANIYLKNMPSYDYEDKVINKGKNVTDAYYNEITQTGSADYSLGKYDYENLTLNWGLWVTLWTSNWVFRKIIEKPAEDMIKKGITLIGDIPSENKKRILNYIKRLRPDLIYAVSQGRLFGGGISLILLDKVNNNDLGKDARLVRDKIRKSKTLRLITYDRWYGIQPSAEKVTNLNDPEFGLPKYYTIDLGDGKTQKVHHSWCMRLGNRKPPRFLKQQLMGWDVCEGAHIFNELMRDDKLRSTIPALIEKSLTEVVQMDGMRGLFSGTTGANNEQIEDRLSMVTKYRTYRNIAFLDGNDKYSQFQYAATGLGDILNEQKDQVAGAADTPRVIVYGETKGGLTSDRPAELEIYAGTINGKQEIVVRPMYNKLLPFLFEMTGTDVPDNIDFNFNPILEMNKKQKLEIVEKITNINTMLIQDGIISPKRAAMEIATMSSETDFGDTLDDEFVNKLSDNVIDPTDLGKDDNQDTQKKKKFTLFKKQARLKQSANNGGYIETHPGGM